MKPTRQVEATAAELYNAIVPQFENHGDWKKDVPKALIWEHADKSHKVIWFAIARHVLANGYRIPGKRAK